MIFIYYAWACLVPEILPSFGENFVSIWWPLNAKTVKERSATKLCAMFLFWLGKNTVRGSRQSVELQICLFYFFRYLLPENFFFFLCCIVSCCCSLLKLFNPQAAQTIYGSSLDLNFIRENWKNTVLIPFKE